MDWERLRRRTFLGGVSGTIAGLAGCNSISPDRDELGQRPEVTETDVTTIPPHDHSGPESGGDSIAPATASIERQQLPYSYVVYERDGEIRALNGATEREEFSGTDATTVIQQAIDATSAETGSGGTVLLRQGEYRIGEHELQLRSHVHLIGEGSGATILKLKDGINGRRGETRTTVITVKEGVEHASIRNLEIDGNESGNREVPPYPMSPHHHGIMIHGSSPKVPEDRKPAYITVEDVYVHDTVRSNVVLAGRNCRLKNLRLENSATDHWLYMGGATNCVVDGLFLGGFARTDGVVLGTDGRRCTGNTITNVKISGIRETPYQNDQPEGFDGRYPSLAFSLRPGEAGLRGDNTIENVDVNIPNAKAGQTMSIRHPDTTVTDLTYHGPFNEKGILDVGSAGTGSKIRDATLNVDGLGNQSKSPITQIKGSNVLLSSVTVDDAADLGLPAIAVIASDGPIAHVTIRDGFVSTSNRALLGRAANGQVKGLVVDNLYDEHGAGVETGSADVEFEQRNIYP